MINAIIDTLKDKLEDYKDTKQYASELSFVLLEQYTADGSITYNTQDARDWIFSNSEEISYVVEDLEKAGEDAGVILPNPFYNSEQFMIAIYERVAEQVLGHCKLIDSNWNETIELNEKNILKLQQQLEQQKTIKIADMF